MEQMDYLYILIGALGIILIGRYIPEIKKLDGQTVRIDQIQGIDLNSLAICRQKGLL